MNAFTAKPDLSKFRKEVAKAHQVSQHMTKQIAKPSEVQRIWHQPLPERKK